MDFNYDAKFELKYSFKKRRRVRKAGHCVAMPKKKNSRTKTHRTPKWLKIVYDIRDVIRCYMLYGGRCGSQGLALLCERRNA